VFINRCPLIDLIDLIDLIILYISLIDYSKCVINLTGGIDSFKRFILVYRSDCFIVRAP
jgi:hypothetical protein